MRVSSLSQKGKVCGYVELFDCDTKGRRGCSLEKHHRTTASRRELTVLRKSVPQHADTVSHRAWQPLCWQGTANYKIQKCCIYMYIYIKHISSYPEGERGCYKWCVARSRLAHFWVGLIHLPSMKERVCPQGAHRTAQDALAAVRLTTFIKCSDWQACLGSLWHLVPRSQLGFSRDSEQWYMRESRMPHWTANKVGKKILLQSTQGRK